MKKRIMIGLIISLFFIVIFFFIKDNRSLTLIESFIKDTTLFIEEVIDVPLDYIDTNLKKINKKNKLYKKYEILKEENEYLKQVNTKYENTKKELDSLKSNLNLKNSLIDYQIIDAYVINRNVNAFYDKLIIDKGSKDGIKENMAVINSNGLVGQIIKVTKHNSTVKLLTSIDRIGVSTNDHFGLVTSYQDGYFIVEGISEEVKKGDLLMTIGTNNIPKGLKIGYIVKSVTDKFNLTKKIYVKSYVNFANLDYVMVLNI